MMVNKCIQELALWRRKVAKMNPNGVQVLNQYLPYLVGVFVFLFILRAVRVAQEYERAVIFSFGRVTRKPRGPGLYVIWPWERSLKVDIRINTLAIQPQDCITNDNVTVRVDAVAYFHVSNPVSYTHLDVYKRQYSYSGGACGKCSFSNWYA